MKMSSSEAVVAAEKKGKFDFWKAYIKATDVLTSLFPLWTVLFAGIALKRPETFAWFNTNYFTASLAALMLSMGITLTPADFERAFQQPGPGESVDLKQYLHLTF